MELHVPAYQQVIKWLAGIAWEKARRLPEGHPRKQAAGFDRSFSQRLKRSNWRQLGPKVCEEAGIGATIASQFNQEWEPPWRTNFVERWETSCELVNGSRKTSSEEIQKWDAEDTLSKLEAELYVKLTVRRLIA